MTTVGVLCAALCVLVMVAMMGGAGWLMSKLRPGDQHTSDVPGEATAHHVEPVA
jgi:hypothetical protein